MRRFPVFATLVLFLHPSQQQQDSSRPNIILVITDQNRAATLPADRRSEQPALTHFSSQSGSISFTAHHTATSECSPSRATILTGLYPSQHGVRRTPGELDPSLPNVLRTLSDAGYDTRWIGKWHLSNTTAGPERYGADRWDPPDAGTNLKVDDTLGGGGPDNDRRFVDDAVAFLRARARAGARPFFLVVSLVNPHDVHAVARADFDRAGYDADAFVKYDGTPPPSYADDLRSKPRAVRTLSSHATFGNLTDPRAAAEYAKFYAYLRAVVDGHVGTVLASVRAGAGRRDTAVLLTSDHGEMGLAFGLREKRAVAYDPAVRVPMVLNLPSSWWGDGRGPSLPPPATAVDIPTSHVDVFPTLLDIAGLAGKIEELGLPGSSLLRFVPNEGQSATRLFPWTHFYTGISSLARRRATKKTGGSNKNGDILFTFDEEELADCPYLNSTSNVIPHLIRCLRSFSMGHKYMVYYDPNGTTFEYELYDMIADPDERINLAHDVVPGKIWTEMHRRLSNLMDRMGATPEEFEWERALPHRWK